MSSLRLIDYIQKNFSKHRDEIAASPHPFAIVKSSSIEYYDDREAIYSKYPYLKPDGTIYFGTRPILVDIKELRESSKH